MVPSRFFAKILLIMLPAGWISGQGQIGTLAAFHQVDLNPAAAGGDGNLMVGAGYRNQWTGLVSPLQTSIFHLEGGCQQWNTGFALRFHQGNYGNGVLVNNNLAGMLAIHLPGRVSSSIFGIRSRKYILSLGLQFGVGQKKVDWSRFVFTDQLDPYIGLYTDQSSALAGNDQSNFVFDIATGARFKMELNQKGTYLSLGASIHNANSPVETFLNAQNTLNPKFTLMAFTYFQLSKYVNKPKYLGIGWVWQSEYGLRTQMLSVSYDVVESLIIGVGMRSQQSEFFAVDVESLSVMFQYRMGNLTVGYSYDFTLSDIGVQTTQGSHEIGLIYRFNTSLCNSSSRRARSIDCFRLNRSMKEGTSAWRM